MAFRSGNSREFRENRSGRCPRRQGSGFGRERPQRRFDDGDSGSFERRRPQMHEATCDKCGKDCEVPFRPTEGKPVLCSDCFNKSGSSPRQRFGFVKRSNTSSSGISQEQYKEINKKLDKILGILETIEFEEIDEEDEESESDEEDSEEDNDNKEESGSSEEESEGKEESSETNSKDDSEEEKSIHE